MEIEARLGLQRLRAETLNWKGAASVLPKLLPNPNPNPNLNLKPNPCPGPNPDQVLPKLLWLSRHEPAALVATSAVHLAAAAGDTVGAYMASKEGAAAAEQAFYDPSILGSLYFPQNEMYAVFLPALLPMFVAVLSTVKQH